MIYSVITMRFKRPYQTTEARTKLGVADRTLWKWGESGKIRMIRDGSGARLFDGEEIDELAKRMPKHRLRGITAFPGKKPKK